jgi:hypothetical protein
MISFLVAPVFYLAPIGVGALALWRFRERGWSAWLPITFLFGAVVMTRVFEAAEWAEVVDSYYHAMVAAAATVSLVGFVMLIIAVRQVSLRWDAILLGALVALPSYAYWYFWVSRFPFTDLFQDVHPMKMAEEFARTHVLNGLDSNSYIPVKPVLNGMLISLFDYNQLLGVWALAPWTAIFRLLVAWQASRLVGAGGNKMLVFVLISGLLFAFDLTNGMLCVFGAILLLVLLVDIGEMFERRVAGAAIAFILPIAAHLFWRLLYPHPLANAIMLVVVATGAALLPRNQEGARWSAIMLAMILVGCLVPLHRGSLLFTPIVAFASAAWILRERRWVLIAATLTGSVALPVALGCAALVLGAALLHIALPFSLQDKFLPIVSRLTSLAGAETLLGAGVKNAAIEWGQAVGPLFALVLGTVFVWSIAANRGRTVWKDPLFVVPWGLGAGLTCIVLTGFPYAYRAMPFVCVFFALALSMALPPLWAHLKEPRGLAVAAPLALGLVYALAMRIAPLSAYLDLFHPLLVYSAVAAVLAYVLLYWTALPRAASLLAVLTVLLSVDRLSGRVALFPHAYGYPQEAARAISHYDGAELKIALKLKEMAPTTLVVSDPLTLSIIRARTGLNGPFAYSNLDSLSEEPDRYLRNLLAVFSGGDRQKACGALLQMREIARDYRHLVKRLWQPQERLDAVVVYSARTRAWAHLAPGKRASYFPSPETLDDESVRTLEHFDPGAMVEDGKVALARLSCNVTRNE